MLNPAGESCAVTGDELRAGCKAGPAVPLHPRVDAFPTCAACTDLDGACPTDAPGACICDDGGGCRTSVPAATGDDCIRDCLYNGYPFCDIRGINNVECYQPCGTT